MPGDGSPRGSWPATLVAAGLILAMLPASSALLHGVTKVLDHGSVRASPSMAFAKPLPAAGGLKPATSVQVLVRRLGPEGTSRGWHAELAGRRLASGLVVAGAKGGGTITLMPTTGGLLEVWLDGLGQPLTAQVRGSR